MKTLAALLLVSSVAFAQGKELPGDSQPIPITEADSPVIAPDLPGISVRLRAGEPAPYDGRLLEHDESVRRGKALVSCRGELADAKTNEWLSKPVLIAFIVGGLALGAAAGAGVTAWAMSKK